MPNIEDWYKSIRVKLHLPTPQKQCTCHENDPPPWTGEIHGLSQALQSDSAPMRAFWWMIMLICVTCGVGTTALVIIEYINGPTATSTTIRLVDELEFPAITICPKVPDGFNTTAILGDIMGALPNITYDLALDVLRYFVGGNGLENMDTISYMNRTYLSYLNNLYKNWSIGYTTEEFFNLMQDKYGYKCEELFFECQLGGKTMDCCNDLMVRKAMMRRGICYQTRVGINQTDADDIGRIVFSLKASPSATNPDYNYTQPQIIVYITDNHEQIVDFPRFYLYPNEWNRMRFTARYIELIKKKEVCTNEIFGRDAQCQVRKWYLSNIIYPFNCTLSYLTNVPKLPPNNGVCRPDIIADNYFNNIQLVWNSVDVKEECTPGCQRWDYQTVLQQSQTLEAFDGYTFNLEASFNDLQYEYVKEVYTTSIPGFMSQIGGQFGFFLGLSIITILQMIIYFLHSILKYVSMKCKQVIYESQGMMDVVMKRKMHMNGTIPNHIHSLYPPSTSSDQNDLVATLGHRHLADQHSLATIKSVSSSQTNPEEYNARVENLATTSQETVSSEDAADIFKRFRQGRRRKSRPRIEIPQLNIGSRVELPEISTDHWKIVNVSENNGPPHMRENGFVKKEEKS